MKELEKYFTGQTKISSSALKAKLFKFNVREKECERCKLSRWLDYPIPLELHHKNGNSSDNSLENLQILCGNCHALTHNFRGNNMKRMIVKKTVEEIIHAIKNSYNVRNCLIFLGYAPKGANYSRIYSIMDKYGVDFREQTEEEKIESRNQNIGSLKVYWDARRERAAQEGRFILRNKKPTKTKEEAWLDSRKVDRPSKDDLLKMVWDKSVSLIAKSLNVTDNSVRKWAKAYSIPVPPVGYWAKFNNGHFEECLKIKEDLFSAFNL